MVRSRSARRAFVAAVLGAATLIAVGGTPARAVDELQSRVSGEGVTIGTADPNTVVSRDGGATWTPAYVVAKGGMHPFDGWFPQANVSSAANWINCQPDFTACLNEKVWYRTFIVLPDRPDLSLSFRVLADNAATPYINGVQAGARFLNYGSVNVDPALLHPGVNTFDMFFEDWGGLTGFRWELFGTLEASANPDADQDGVPDPDGDSDGVPDATDNCLTTPNTNQGDNESDGAGDVCDADDDNDGLDDDVDPDPLEPNADSDGDGTIDAADNCIADANADQTDTDGDGQGDACDADDDDDGTPDADDAFPLDPDEDTDTDGDGQGDNGDACPNDAENDADGDGTCGDVDTLPLDPKVTTEQANGGGVCSVVQRLASKQGARVSLCNHLLRAQGAADRGDGRAFTQAMSVFDKELTAQTNGRNAAITTADAATIRALAALWTL